MTWTYLLVEILFLHLSSAVKVEVLAPVRNSTTEAALIITPGADIMGQAYRPLAKAIQGKSSIQLWVVLLEDFLFNTPNPPELNNGVDMAITELKKRGMSSNNVFLSGHSLGGTFVGMYGLSGSGKLKGVLLFAAYLTRSHPLSQYPAPVLTISGDLDGLTRITRIVETFEELENDVKADRTAMYRTPVIVMSGTNHGQFASGTMPPNVKSHDIDPDVTVDEAHQMIAGHVNNFLLVTLVSAGPSAVNAKAAMDQSYNKTSQKIAPFSRAKSWDINANHSSVWSRQAQDLIIDELANYVQIHNEVVSEGDLLLKEPFTSNHTGPTIQTYTAVVMPFDPEDVSLYQQSPVELQVKMKSEGSVQELLPAVKIIKSNLTCKEFNLASEYIMWVTAPHDIKERHVTRGGNIQLNDDVIIDDIAEWYTRRLDLQYGDDGSLTVTSYAFITPTNYPVKELAGMYFCKLLTPYRALEWVAIDSLKHK